MKKIVYLLLVAGTFFLASCSQDSEGVSKVTTYCTFDMNGDQVTYHVVGTPFTDPGCTAYEGEEVVDVTTKSNVDANKSGLYTIVYSAVNSDGFSASTVREVIVYYPNDDIMGNWSASIVRNGSTNRGPYTLELIPFSENTFYIPDLLGGWYWYGSGYGATYAFPALVQFDDSNTLSIVSAYKSAWGSVGQFVVGSVVPTLDTTTGTIHYVAKMSDSDAYLFDVTLTKQ